MVQFTEIESRVVKSLGGRRNRKLGTLSVWEDEESSVDGWWLHSTMNIFHTAVHLKMVKVVNFMLSVFCHS